MDEAKTRITNFQAPEEISSEPACIVLIYPSTTNLGRKYVLDEDRLIIGREDNCDIVIDLDSVSRRHAQIERREGSIFITDQGSTNGTFVNESPIKERALDDGDQIKIGNAIFKFLSGGNVEASYHEAIYRMTIIDGLTEVYNKRYLFEFLDRELSRSLRYQRPLSVVMFDLDHFKVINDTYGHLAGDFVLKDMSHRLRTRIRKEELMARYGGEEFIIVLPEAKQKGALEFGEKIRRLVALEPFVFEEQEIPLTISVGIATIDGKRPIEAGQLIKQADDNLYKAKRAGRDRVVG